MNALAWAQLIIQVGFPAAQEIRKWIVAEKEVTDEMWALLETLAKYRSEDALTAAGIKIVDGKVVPL